jgi:hypothetical protein
MSLFEIARRLAFALRCAASGALAHKLIGHRPDGVAARWNVAAQAEGIDVAKTILEAAR